MDASSWSQITLHNYFVIEDENNQNDRYAETSYMGPYVCKYVMFGYEQYLFIGLNLQAKQQCSFYLSKKKKKELNFLCRSLQGFRDKITYVDL